MPMTSVSVNKVGTSFLSRENSGIASEAAIDDVALAGFFVLTIFHTIDVSDARVSAMSS